MSRGYDPARLRTRLREVRLGRAFRMIARGYSSTPLGTTPAPSRFSDPQGRYAVLYAAASIGCTLMEALVRDKLVRRRRRELPLSEAKDRLIVSIRSEEPLALIDLREDGPVRIGAPTAVAHDTNHAAGRALSAAVHGGVAEADGFIYLSRFTNDDCVGVFDRAFGKLRVIDVDELVRLAEFHDVLEEYDIVLTSPPA